MAIDWAVRRATVDDIDTLTSTMALAFRSYPWTDFALGADDRDTRLRLSFSHYLRLTIIHLGEVWMTEDGASAAVWLQPDPPPLPQELVEATERVEANTTGSRRAAVAAIQERLDALRPTAPFWTLASVGTTPAARGRGAASAVVTPVLKRLDDARMPAVLETSSAENVRFYLRLGFAVSGVVEGEGDVPTVWLMTRDAVPGH
jgi:GNAT superfamily N-acetyltransferase